MYTTIILVSLLLILYISCTYQASLTYSFSSLDLSNLDHGNHHFNKIWRMGAGNVTDDALHSAVHDRLTTFRV